MYAASAYAIMYGGWINVDYWMYFNSLLAILFTLQVCQEVHHNAVASMGGAHD
jgi:hypothetical protein